MEKNVTGINLAFLCDFLISFSDIQPCENVKDKLNLGLLQLNYILVGISKEYQLQYKNIYLTS